MLPADDLYARLELSLDASFEAVEVAWRALLKRHHPDVAGGGADADERSKRINVAHDWLSDPELRARYDRERHPGTGHRRGGRAVPQPPPRRGATGVATSPPRTVRRRPADREEALRRHLDRVEGLTPDELDRLSLAETPPVAFIASISRFLSPDRIAALDAVERRVHERLPRAVRWNPAVRDAAVGYAQELVLGPFLDEHLSPPFRDRVRERLTRGWSAAVEVCEQAAAKLAEEGISADVLDLRSLVPLDVEAMVASITRTGRCVVVHEAPLSAGFGAEVVATLQEEAFYSLDAPIARVTSYDTPYPPASMESAWLPSAARVVNAARKIVNA